jgi:hypothetical protein
MKRKENKKGDKIKEKSGRRTKSLSFYGICTPVMFRKTSLRTVREV